MMSKAQKKPASTAIEVGGKPKYLQGNYNNTNLKNQNTQGAE